jgi:hypothetical protein
MRRLATRVMFALVVWAALVGFAAAAGLLGS